MKINYPIKYAAMPIVEQVGWYHGLHELEREYDVICYIVSKCYLISDLTKYTIDGRNIKEYEIVFPYQLSEFNRWKRVTPAYSLIHGYCTNAHKVDVVFDSYEEALNYATTKNEMLCENTWKCLPIAKDIIEKIQEKQDRFAAKLEEYKLLEEHILLNTSDIEVGKNKKLNNIIRVTKDKGKILSCTLYEIIQIFDREKFVVYSIKEEQYNNLVQLINEDKNIGIKELTGSIKGLLIHKTKTDIIKIAIEEGIGAYYIKNNDIIYDSELDKVTQNDFENIDEDTLIFYTTETIEDILNSYKKYSTIDFNEIKGTVLKKIKK